MKLLSIAIPCYNSQDYMENCIESLLVGGEEVEILIVDDGSSDRTAEIADDYARKYPTIVKAIHQENGGHGEAVNAGIRNATGLYFKVVDSDDWVNKEAYVQILKTLYELLRGPQTVDLLISNFVYEKQGATRKKIMQYRKCLPQDRIFGWEEVKHMPKGKYLLMHSMIYRTKLLHECNLELPKHTFYVDNLFAFEPLPYVKNLYYLDVNFYRYFIGRDDQSVNEKVMIKRIDQQIRCLQPLLKRFTFPMRHIQGTIGMELIHKRLHLFGAAYTDMNSPCSGFDKSPDNSPSRSAGTKKHHLSVGRIEPLVKQSLNKTGHVGIIPDQFPIVIDYRIDRSDHPRVFINFIEQRYDRCFVRNRNIPAPELQRFKSVHCLRQLFRAHRQSSIHIVQPSLHNGRILQDRG